MTLESKSESLSVKLPIPESVSLTESEGQGTVFADNDFAGATVLAKEDGSVQIATIIDSPDSATHFDYEIGSDSETTLQTEDDGSVSILGRDGGR